MSTDIRLQPYVPTTPSEIVEFDTTDPNLPGTVFTPDSQQASNTLYVSTEPTTIGQTWIWNTTTNLYETYTVNIPDSTPFWLYGTTIDAGSNKTAFIQRNGPILINSTSTTYNPLYVYNRKTSGTANGPRFIRDSRTTGGYGLLIQNYKWSALGSNTINQLRVNHDGSLLINDAYTLPNVDGTAGQVPTTDGAGNVAWQDGGSSIPQASVIYVDSSSGVDSTGRGNINEPYLTPEYALADITNTGTITGNTATNTTLSAISDIDNANLEIGMYVSSTGIPFGTIIVAKGNEGGDANTVTLSRAATNTGLKTVTWIKTYEVRINGNFVVTSNLFKEGMYINSEKAKISWGAFNLFNLSTTVLKTPYCILGKGDYFGTNIASRFIYGNATQTADFTLDINFGNIETVSTTTTFELGVGSGIINIKGGYVNARFGRIGTFLSGTFDIDFKGYGLLYGLAFSFSTAGILKGRYQTPSAIIVVSGAYYTHSTADLYGSTSWSGYCTHKGILQGTSQALGGDYYIINRANAGTLTGVGSVTLEGAATATINPTAGTNLILRSGSFALVFNSVFAGTITNYGNLSHGSNSGTGTLNNYGTFTTSGGSAFGSFSGTVNNYGTMTLMNLSSGAITFNNHGILYTNTYGLNISTGAKLYNYGILKNSGNLSNGIALVNVNTATSLFDNYGKIEYTTNDPLRSPIQIRNGKTMLRQGSVININNGKSPVRVGTVESGITTSATAFKLIQTSKSFSLTVFIGGKVYNSTTGQSAFVTAIDSNTQLSLDTDIMNSGDSYVIYGLSNVYYFGVTTNCDGTTYGLLQSFDGISPAPNDLVGGTLYEDVNY